MTEIVVVGDVHGERDRLARLLDRLGGRGERVVLIGDYVNRGPSSCGVMDLLVQLRAAEPERFTFLAGNHDLAFLDYVETGDFAPFAARGGLSTLHSYLGEVHGEVHTALLSSMPAEHVAFLRALRPCWETPGILVSHMGYCPESPADRSMRAMARVAHPTIFRARTHPVDLVVCGHYHQRGGRPFRDRGLVCVDTGAGSPGGVLTALVLPGGEILQA
jgi:serine/threonine protein phosphatase 1